MGFRKINNEFSFADVVLESSKKHNRSLKNMEKLNKSIDWNRVEDMRPLHNPTKKAQNEPSFPKLCFKYS